MAYRKEATKTDDPTVDANGNGFRLAQADTSGPNAAILFAEIYGIPFQILAKRTEEKDGVPMRVVDVWGDYKRKPARGRMEPLAEVIVAEDEETELVPLWENREFSRALTRFANEVLKTLRKNEVLGEKEEAQIFSCDTLIRKVCNAAKAEAASKTPSVKPKPISENTLLAHSYGGKIDERRGQLRALVAEFNGFKKNAKLEDVKLLMILTGLDVKEKEKVSKKDRIVPRRVFNQHMDQNRFFSWYLKKKGPNGKLSAPKYYGTELPDDLDLELDKVNFHPEYVAEFFGLTSIEPMANIAAA